MRKSNLAGLNDSAVSAGFLHSATEGGLNSLRSNAGSSDSALLPSYVTQVGIDWGGKGKKLAVAYRTSAGDITVVRVKTLLTFLALYGRQGLTIAIEPSFDSFRTQDRERVKSLAAEKGVEFHIYSTRTVWAARKRNGWGEKYPKVEHGNDENDATLLLLVEEEGRIDFHRGNSNRPSLFSRDGFYKTVAKWPVIDGRKMGWPEELVSRYIKMLPPAEQWDEGAQKILFERKGKRMVYVPSVVVPWMMAAEELLKHGYSSRAEFDRQMGFYHLAYPTVFRAYMLNLLNGKIATLIRRDLKERTVSAEEKEQLLKHYQRTTRRINRQIRAVVLNNFKATGFLDSAVSAGLLHSVAEEGGLNALRSNAGSTDSAPNFFEGGENGN